MNKLIENARFKYLFFLSIVVILILTNQGIVQYSINLQKQDAQIINISGRQRMLSQRISKLILFINYNHSTKDSLYNLDTLKKIVPQWENAHKFLKQTNAEVTQDAKIDSLLDINTPRIEAIAKASKALIQNPTDININNAIKILQKNELPFLFTMEKTVDSYQEIAEEKLQKLQFLELLLSIISIIILLFTFLFFVLPAIKELIKRGKDLSIANQQLIANEEELRENFEELLALEEELKLKEQYNKIFIEQAPGAIAMFNNDMEYMAASKNWILDYGLENQEIIGKSHYEIFPEIGENWKKIHQECLNGEVNICDEAPFLRANGSLQWLTWEVRPWYTIENKIGGIIMYTSDITANKLLETERERIQQILDKTNEIARIGTWEVDLIKNTVTWSKITKEIHEVEPDFEPDLSKGIDFYKEGESRDTIKRLVTEAIKTGSSFDVELEIVTAKNRIIWIRSIGQAELVDGKCTRLYGVFQDINEIKLAEEKINKSNTELKAIFNSGHVSIIGTDLNGTITFFNRGAEILLGYSADEMIGKHTPSIIHKEEEVIARGKELSEEYNTPISGFEVFVYLTKNNQFESREWTYIRKDGSHFPVELVVSATRNEQNEITGFMGVATDVTERVNRKKELQEINEDLEILTTKLTTQNNQLASFAHITSHNLRSPVSNLNSLLYFYRQSETVEDKEELFDKFEIVINHLTTTLNTLIDTLKIKEETNHEVEKLAFEDILNKTKEILSGQIIETDAAITSDFSEIPEIIYNKTYLESIFLNLLSNAIKYRSQERPLKIYLQTSFADNRIKLIITDNGLGIDLEKHGDKLFGLNKTFHRHADAKGIGLYLTKTQIESMGGNISAKSIVNEGTSFIVNF